MTTIEAAPRAALPFDLRQRTVLSRPQVARLRELHRPVADEVGKAFSRLLKARVGVELDRIEMVPARHQAGAADRCELGFRVQPGDTPGVLTVGHSAAVVLGQKLLGGGWDKAAAGRVPTALELRLIRRLLGWAVLRPLCEGWPVEKGLSVQPGEMHLRPERFAPDWEIVGRVRFALEGLPEPATIELWLSLSTMEALAGADPKSADERKADKKLDPKRGQTVVSAAQDVTLEARVELGESELSVGEVLSLKVGDVVRLDSTVLDELSVIVQGEPAFRGRPGLSNGHLAIQISGVIEQE